MPGRSTPVPGQPSLRLHETAETERLVRVWLRESTQDLAVPSQVMPFIEPFLPYYESLRDEAAFLELLGDIQGD